MAARCHDGSNQRQPLLPTTRGWKRNHGMVVTSPTIRPTRDGRRAGQGRSLQWPPPKSPGFPTPALHDLPGSRPAILYNLLEETKAVVKYLHLLLTFQKTKLILAWKDIPQSSIHHIYGSTLLPSLRYHILNLHQILLI